MLIRDEHWEKIRHLFSEPEKEQLRSAITGEVICPRGYTVATASLPQAILDKLTGQVP